VPVCGVGVVDKGIGGGEEDGRVTRWLGGRQPQCGSEEGWRCEEDERSGKVVKGEIVHRKQDVRS